MKYLILFILSITSCVVGKAQPILQSNILLDRIPNCAPIRIIKFSPSGKYIFIADKKNQAFLITNSGELVFQWLYSDANYDSVWNKQMDNQTMYMKIMGSIERAIDHSKNIPKEYRQRYLDNFKPCRNPVILPPRGMIVQKDTFEMPAKEDRIKMLTQKFDNAYFANDSLLFINGTITIMALDTFGFISGTMPPIFFSKCYTIIQFSITDKQQQFNVLQSNFDKNTFPMECLGTFIAKDSQCEEFYHQTDFDRGEDNNKFIAQTDFTKLGAIGLFNKNTAKLERTFGIIPESYRQEKLIFYSNFELLAQPKGDSLLIIYPLWDSVQICHSNKVSSAPLNILPNNDTMFYGFKNSTTEGFSELYSKQNFFISQLKLNNKNNSVVLVIQQKNQDKKPNWLIREYDRNWKVIKDKIIKDTIENNKIYYTAYKELNNSICYVTMDKNENWQLNFIAF